MTEAAISYAIRKARLGGCSLEQLTILQDGTCTAETVAFRSSLAEINEVADTMKSEAFGEAPRFVQPPRYLPTPAPSQHHQQAPRERMPDDDMPGLIKRAQAPLAGDPRPEPDQGLVDRIAEKMPWGKNGSAHVAAVFFMLSWMVMVMQRSGIA